MSEKIGQYVFLFLTHWEFQKCTTIASNQNFSRNYSRPPTNNSVCDSCDLIEVMFPDSEMVSQMELGRTKLMYIVNLRMAPYFREIWKNETVNSEWYTISFIESLNKGRFRSLWMWNLILARRLGTRLSFYEVLTVSWYFLIS